MSTTNENLTLDKGDNLSEFYMPTIRFELDHFKEKLIAMIQVNDKEVVEIIKNTIDNLEIEPFLHQQVKEAAHNAIQRGIEHYFEHGNGYDLIKKAMSDSLDKVFASKLEVKSK